MSKHIHIHMHPAARTADAGFNEADHPRDGGKFTSGSKVNHPGSNQPGTYHSPVSAAHSKASGHKEPHSWVTNSYGTKLMHPTASLSKYKPAGYLPDFKPVGANAHKLIDPGTAALMNSGQRALSGLPNKPAGKSMAQIAQGLINKGAVKPGSTTPASGTAPKLRATGLQSSKSDAVNK